jgi:hypothetical protein
MEDISQVFNKILGRGEDVGHVRYWEEPERCGWLMKQGTCVSLSLLVFIHTSVCTAKTLTILLMVLCFTGEFLKSWRRRWFVLKDGRLFWFKSDHVTQDVVPRGVVKIDRCLSIKGAEEAINRPFAFEVSTPDVSMYFIADSEKEKEDWINSVGKAIVRHSRCVMDQENVDYTTGSGT